VSWAGAGIFFFWQLGAMKLLAEKYDLSKVPMAGASGGSLASVLAACGVNADTVIERAYQMSMEQKVWDRKLSSSIGVWTPLIEKWLDELLPDNAADLCRGRVTVVITTLPDWQQIGVSDFKDKRDLINACMASSHVPVVLDYKLTRPYRGKACVDGSFPDFFTGLNSELLRTPQGVGSSAVVFDYFDDSKLTRRGRMDMLEIKSYDEIRTMYRLGYDYAAQLHSEGRFAHYELEGVTLTGDHGRMSEVLVPEHSHAPGSVHHHQAPMGLVLTLEQDDDELAACMGMQGEQDGQKGSQASKLTSKQEGHAQENRKSNRQQEQKEQQQTLRQWLTEPLSNGVGQAWRGVSKVLRLQ